DEAAADLLLQLRPVIDATPQRALEHLLRTGLRQHRLEVAAQFALGELLVAAAVARDRQHGVPARALDPVHAIAEPEREARVAAHVRTVLRRVAFGQREERQLAQRRLAWRHRRD